jgi:prepilin-type N-terminal cleavage/methylation domain-containing protein
MSVSQRTNQAPCVNAVKRRRRRRADSAFTLTELLIVIGIIVILIAIAVPAFRSMSGGRSIDAAANTLAAVIGRARAEAIGSGRYAGVLFYIDPGSDRVGALVVRQRVGPGSTAYAAATPGTVVLDMTPEGEFTLMPVGIGVQVLRNAATTGTTVKVRTDDGYIGYNTLRFVSPATGNPGAVVAGTRCGGAVLFDGGGRLVVERYRLAVRDDVAPTPNPNQLIKTLTGNPELTFQPTIRLATTEAPGAAELPYSSIGVAVFDSVNFYEKYSNRPAADGDPYLNPTLGTYTTTGGERDEEQWLDQNALPFLVNRFNGTLIRGE